MKKSHKIFLSILFCFLVAMPFATSFLWQGNSIETSEENLEVVAPKVENIADVNDKEDTEEITTWDTPTYKTYDDYFIDYNITTDTITQDDLTGSGSLSNPYVVHSTKGFLYLSNYSLSKKSFNNAYLEIKCDIILNDESFDEDGNPSGGDGIVYAWNSISTGKNAVINGNNFHLKGLYYSNDEHVSTNACRGLFGDVSLQEMSNLVCENFYVNSYENTYLLARQIISCKNIILKTGTIKSYYTSSGIARVAKEVENCKNYAKIIADTTTGASQYGGLIGTLGSFGIIKNCENYGEIIGNDHTGGIVGRLEYGGIIENCQNFGFIKGRYHVGGIVGYVYGEQSAKIKDCQNYGDVTTVKSAAAGICSTFEKALQILSCENFGFVYRKNYMQYCGEIVYAGNSKNSFLIVKDTTANSKSGLPFLGIGSSSVDNLNVQIKNCKITYDDVEPAVKTIICQESWMLALIDIDGFSVDFKGENFNLKLFSFFDPGSVISMKNIIFNIDCQKNTTTNYIKEKQANIMEVNVGDILINSNENGVEKKYYYGSDFSGFYVDWKTGKIGLKGLSGKGFFQNTLTEEMLIAKKYVKKEFSA